MKEETQNVNAIDRLEALEAQVPRDLLYIGHFMVENCDMYEKYNNCRCPNDPAKIVELDVQKIIAELTKVVEKLREIERLENTRQEMIRQEEGRKAEKRRKEQEAIDQIVMKAAKVLEENGIEVNAMFLNGSQKILKTQDGAFKYDEAPDDDIPF